MKEIKLTQGKIALVDDGDFERINQFKWHAHAPNNAQWYARRNIRKEDGRQTSIILHRFILNVPRGILIDHRDGDGLNNQRDNLRLCNKAQNAWNQQSRKGTSQYKGVQYMCNTTDRVWRTGLFVNGEYKYLGCFPTEEEAALAYNKAAENYFGEFAYLNEVTIG